MPNLPAFCDNCGTIFPSGFFVEGASQMTLVGNTAGPCPRCGGRGHIPDGVFNFIDSTIEILSAPNRTIDELKRFAAIIGSAKERKATLEQVSEEVAKEVPELSYLMSLLIPKSSGDFYGFLAFLLAVVQMLTGQDSNNDAIKTEETKLYVEQKVEINQVINNIYVNQLSEEDYPKHTDIKQPKSSMKLKKPDSVRVKKIGRNEPCPCESGLKYKRCHGKQLVE